MGKKSSQFVAKIYKNISHMSTNKNLICITRVSPATLFLYMWLKQKLILLDRVFLSDQDTNQVKA